MNTSTRINELFRDPNRDEQEFWLLLKSYIARMANGLVTQEFIADLTQDILFQVWTSLDKFEHQPSHNGSSFTRWVSGIAFRRAGDMKRAVYGAREVPASNVGTYIDGDKWESTDLSSFATSLTDREYEDALSAESWPALVKSTLTRTRESLQTRDIALFDEIRTRGEIAASAQAVGLKNPTGYSRVRNWRKLAESPGPRPSSKQGAPCSTQPGEQLCLACVLKNPAAMIIRDEWRFKSPVVLVSADEFDTTVSRGYTTRTISA